MNQEEKKAMLVGVSALCEAFGRKPSEATYKAFEWGLDGLTVAQMNQAFSRALRETRKFMPPPADLRILAGEQTAEDRSVRAWQTVLDNLYLGPYKHVDFAEDLLINATIRNLGGWPNFIARFTDEEAEKWVRKEFLHTYERLAHARVNGTACEALPGLSTGGIEVANGERLLTPPAVHAIANGDVDVVPAIERKKHPYLIEDKLPRP